MKDEMFFCERWGGIPFFSPYKPMPRKKAEKLHADGKLYCVLVGSETRPRATIHLTENAATVSFMNGDIDPYVEYTFIRNSEKNPSDRLFLSAAIERHYDGNFKVVLAYKYFFHPDGRTRIVRTVLVPERYSQDMETVTDVSGNWSDYPEFGEYDDLLRFERAPKPDGVPTS